MERQGSLLRVLKNRNFLALWIGQIISQFGDRLAQMALIGLYLKQTAGISLSHSVPVMRNLFFFSTLPILLFSPVAGVYVDRWSRKKTLIATDLLRAGLILLIPLLAGYTDGMWSVYGVIFLVFTVTCFFSPAKSAIIPNLVKKRELLAANSLSNITRLIAMIGGVTAGGIIVAWTGTKMSFYLDSLSFLLSGLAILAIRIKEDPPPEESKDGIRRVAKELVAGLNFIRKKKRVKFVATSLFILMGASGIGYLLVTVFVTKALNLGTIGLSVLATFLGIGMLAGSLIYGHFGEQIEREKVIVGGTLICGVCAVLLGGSKSLFLLSLGVSIIGFIASPIMIAAYTLTQELTPDRIRGRVFSALEVIINSSFLFFIWVAGVLGAWLPIQSIFYLTGVGLLVYGSKTLVLRYTKE
ncbi:MFS transporter [Candidatus Aerophobetes bacterium]|nr:MFS transporter [Candidatus Aerophobetes bacterium]